MTNYLRSCTVCGKPIPSRQWQSRLPENKKLLCRAHLKLEKYQKEKGYTLEQFYQQIRDLRSQGYTYTAIGQQFGLTQATIFYHVQTMQRL
jgi:DNA-binding NarL/FixJ family response regulator